MKMLIVIVLVMVGGVLHADSVFARGGSSGAGAAAGGAAGGDAAAGSDGAPGEAAAGPAADGSTAETGPGDRLGGPPAGFANDPSIYRSPVTAWPGEIEYPSASPGGPAVIASPPVVVGPPAVIVTSQPPVVVRAPGRVDLLTTPLMCPGINASDPRTC